MNLRHHSVPALRWSWRLALLGVALLAIARSAPIAAAGTSSYPSPLYLSGAQSSSLTGSYGLVGTTPPATPSVLMLAAAAGPGLTGSYSYKYTVYDTTVGESAARETVPPTVTVANQNVYITGLPAGVSIRLYRANGGLYRRVADQTTDGTYTDSMSDATFASQPVFPQSQNRIGASSTPGCAAACSTGYQDFSPGLSAPASGPTTATTAITTTPNGKGWIVDGPGSVAFAPGTWTFQVKVGQTGALGTAHLVVGMWKVKVASNAITSSTLIVDPTCSVAASGCGESLTDFDGASARLVSQAVTVSSTIALASDEHLYVQFWRRETVAAISGADANRTAMLYGYDPQTSITHPAAVQDPADPTLTALPARINNNRPTLTAGFSDPVPGDTGTLKFELCSTSACGASLLQTYTSASIASGASASFIPPSALPDGTYYWRVQATDSIGNVSGWSSASFTLDTIAPNLPTLTSPAASARATQVTATYTEPDTSDTTGTVSFEVCADVACTDIRATYTSGPLANGTPVNFAPAILDGSYFWRVKAQDGATNTTAWSAPRAFRLDTTAPGATTIVSPAAGSALAAVPTLSATYVNADAGDSGPLSFQVCSDAACTSVLASGSSATLTDGVTGSWKPTSLADGAYYARVRALDVAGNASAWSAPIAFSLDATPPLVPVGSGVTPGARLRNVPTLSATFADAAGAAGTLTFQLCSASSCGTVLQTNTANGVANGGSASWTPGALSDGTYYWRARAQDSVGNQSAWSSATTFVIDTTAPPAPTFGSPAAGARIATRPLSVTYTDPDAGDTSTVTLQLCADALCSSVVASNTSGSVSVGTAVSWTPSVADGTYYWRVAAQDAAGNTSAWSATRAVVVDTVAPAAPTLAAPADGTALASRPTLSATFTDSDPGDSGTLVLQICADAACSTVVATGSSATLTNGGVGSWQPSTLADGAYFGRVRAVDAAGNASAWSAPRGFSLDTGPPAVPVSASPAPGTRTAQTPSLKATYADTAGAPGTLTFQLCTTSSCGTVLQTGVASGTASDASGSWTPDGLSDSTYYWRARAEDSAGNQSAWSAVTAFVVDSTPPPEPTLLSAAGLRAKAAPVLRARSVRAAADEPVRLAFQVCSDAACALVRGVGYATAEGGDATAQWQPPALPDGTYYWRAFAVDGAGNESGWSATRAFVIDNTPPAVPTAAADAPERGKRAQLAATFASADPTDGGTLFFQLCTDVDCASVIATGSDEGLGAGSMGRWTASLLHDGDYYWRARAEDVAGNSSEWSATQHLTVDTTPPGKPRGFTGTLTAKTLSLRWKSAVDEDAIDSYILYVNGNRSRSVDASLLGIDIHLRAGDTRSFAVAAVDSTGNIGTPTRAVVVVPRLARLTLDQAKAATADQGLLLRWSKRTSKATPTRVIGQSPAPQTIVETGSLVTVVVDGPARSARR